MADINLGEFSVGATKRLRFTLTKDGVAWEGIASVTLSFEKPDRETTFNRAMVLESANIWYYDLLTTDLDTAGYWTLGVTVVAAAITEIYPDEIGLHANSRP